MQPAWSDYFDRKEALQLGDRGLTVNLYRSGKPGTPLLLCLHGAGYTGLTWALVAAQLKSSE